MFRKFDPSLERSGILEKEGGGTFLVYGMLDPCKFPLGTIGDLVQFDGTGTDFDSSGSGAGATAFSTLSLTTTQHPTGSISITFRSCKQKYKQTRIM
jgi:hypothetical protein